MELTVGDLDEGALLARIFPRLADSKSVELGPGDDAAIVRGMGHRTVVSIDTQVQDQDFRLQWNNGYRSTGFDVGWKAAAQNMSDINAMGGTTTALVVSLTLPPSTPVAWVEDLADGLQAAISELAAGDCSVAGGDLSAGREISVTVAVLGALPGSEAVLRSGAKVGDVVAHCGNLGCAAAGWWLLEGSVPPAELTPEQSGLVELFARPRPPLAAGPIAAAAGASAMLDVSDGLVRDASRLARASGVAINLDFAALAALAAPLQKVAGAAGVDPHTWLLGGGEDHGLLCTFPANRPLPDGFTAIGSVVPGGERTPPVSIAGRAATTSGWDHFAD